MAADEALRHPWLTELAAPTVDEALAANALDNLAKFNSDISLKTATFSYIAAQLMSKQEREDLTKVFKAFDVNGDGKLEMDEIKAGYMNHYGKVLSDQEVEEMFLAVDTDKSGYIDYTEFIVAATNNSNMTSEDKLRAAFRMFDKDDSGIIDADEIKQVLCFDGANPLSTESVDEMIRQVDINGDGEIEFDEFVVMMTGLENGLQEQ